jgi:hypothetical protein
MGSRSAAAKRGLIALSRSRSAAFALMPAAIVRSHRAGSALAPVQPTQYPEGKTETIRHSPQVRISLSSEPISFRD